MAEQIETIGIEEEILSPVEEFYAKFSSRLNVVFVN